MESMTSACHVCFCRTVECVLCVAAKQRRRVERSRTQFDQTASASSEPATAVWCVLAVSARFDPDPLLTLTGAQNLHGHPSNLCEPLALSDPSPIPSQMLFAAQSMMFQAAAGLVAAPLAARSVERAAAPSMAVGLVYSTTTGNTETVAGYIAG